MSTPIAIFRTGPHYPALDAAALRRAAAAYDPALHEAPLVVGHPASNSPAYGWVAKLEFSDTDQTLTAAPKQVDPAFAEAVASGRYKKISASFYLPGAPRNPVPDRYYLRHVGFLGGAAPAVKGLPAVEFAGGDEGVMTVEFAAPDAAWLWDDLAAALRGIREWIIGEKGVEAANAVLPAHRIDSLDEEARRLREAATETNDSEETDMTDKTDDNQSLDLGEREAALAAKEQALAAKERALAAAEVTQERRQAEDFTEQLAGQGRILPRDQAGLAELLTAVPQATTIDFIQGESDVPTPGAARDFLHDFLSRLPVQVDFTERAGGALPARETRYRAPAGYTVDAEQLALHQRVKDFAEQHNLSYPDALARVADDNQ